METKIGSKICMEKPQVTTQQEYNSTWQFSKIEKTKFCVATRRSLSFWFYFPVLSPGLFDLGASFGVNILICKKNMCLTHSQDDGDDGDGDNGDGRVSLCNPGTKLTM
jgi:hypothetical protein